MQKQETTTAAKGEKAAAEVIGVGVLTSGASFYLVSSQTEAGRAHVVEQLPARLACDCKGFGYRGRCAHVAAVVAHKARLELERAASVPAPVPAPAPAPRETGATGDVLQGPPARAPSSANRATDHRARTRMDTALLRRSQEPFSLLRR